MTSAVKRPLDCDLTGLQSVRLDFDLRVHRVNKPPESNQSLNTLAVGRQSTKSGCEGTKVPADSEYHPVVVS
jgi:hypothetical protein